MSDSAKELRELHTSLFKYFKKHEIKAMKGAGGIIRRAATEIESLQERLNKAYAEVEIQTRKKLKAREQLDKRTSEIIVHRGQALACSKTVKDAFEQQRERLDAARNADIGKTLRLYADATLNGFLTSDPKSLAEEFSNLADTFDKALNKEPS